ncbi:cation diffusion facilitator family transporter [Azospirillum agricola]|uniref:cation diffusion facilitator family transporter n=1 Tax=Azospirillum agricola TaxID=1720247 RepID=UPI000A0F0FCF|nr:cation diffusion facilitator family transporter [Azospirillum agricola]SMH38077.1 cation diffusion facilitator family transporter [Azospirillum lipoferum]
MHTKTIDAWTHDHGFGQDRVRPAEFRTLLVVVLTAVTMVAEVGAGIAFGSIALLTDGLHMASHAAALGIALLAYIFARRHARNRAFSFGTGKVNALAGFASALLLVFVTLLMLWESLHRLVDPVAIAFDQALVVTLIGLAVNVASAAILMHRPSGAAAGHSHRHHDHDHHDHHEHAHRDHGDAHAHHRHDHDHDHGHHHHGHGGHDHQDHNLRGAILHVLADIATSVLAVLALLGGKHLGASWLDPAIGIVGAVMIARWSWGLLRDTGKVLLDQEAPDAVREAVRGAIEADGDTRVADLHVWSIGPGLFTTVLSVVSHEPRSPDHYKALLPAGLGLVHPVVEVRRCPGEAAC